MRALVLLVIVLAGCEAEPRALEWSLRFNPEELGAGATGFVAEVRRGGCSGEAIWSTSWRAGEEAGRPPRFGVGTVGLAARAIDRECRVFASGCLAVELPESAGAIQVMLVRVAEKTAECASEECREGVCGVADAGAPPMVDGGVDARVPPVDAPIGVDSPGFDCAVCPLGCAEGGGRCAELVPSNVNPMLFDPSAGDFAGIVTGMLDTTACMGIGAMVTMLSDGTSVCLIRVGRFDVADTVTITVVGTRPLIVLAADAVDIRGTIDLGARGSTPGPGGGAGGGRMRLATGRAPGMGGTHAESYDDGGGGGGGLCGAGGSGGRGGAAAGGVGGVGTGAWLLEPLSGGSGGGGAQGGPEGAMGGGGGGAIQITSLVSIAISGRVLAGGGGGAPGRTGGMCGANFGAAGGGGSGGAILLEAPSVSAPGQLVVTAGGGGGSAGACAEEGGPGADGGSSLELTTGGRSSGGFGAEGGSGAGGALVRGGDGAGNTMSSGNGGGGGGGGGCVFIRVRDGAPLPGVTASPSENPSVRYGSVRVR